MSDSLEISDNEKWGVPTLTAVLAESSVRLAKPFAVDDYGTVRFDPSACLFEGGRFGCYSDGVEKADGS